LTLLPKFTVPHAAWFIFYLIELFIKLLIKSKFETPKNKLEESVALGVAAIETFI
jgi:hypothetical protein